MAAAIAWFAISTANEIRRKVLTAALTSGIGYEQLTSRLRKSNVAYTTPGIAPIASPCDVQWAVIPYLCAIQRSASRMAAPASQQQAPPTVWLPVPDEVDRYSVPSAMGLASLPIKMRQCYIAWKLATVPIR